jgi:hypothetical protein
MSTLMDIVIAPMGMIDVHSDQRSAHLMSGVNALNIKDAMIPLYHFDPNTMNFAST